MVNQIIGQGFETGKTFDQYLLELLRDESIIECKALIAFVTSNGLLKIGAAPGAELRNFISRPDCRIRWIVGIDQTTTPDALELLRELVSISDRRSCVRAFSSPGKLFHPKVYIFNREDSTASVLIGSNNLTQGGLLTNFEVSIRIDDLSGEDISNWNNLWDQANSFTNYLFDLNDDIIERVRASRLQDRVSGPRARPIISEVEIEIPTETPNILIRAVPYAKERTSQVHFTKDIIKEYFHSSLGETRILRFLQFQKGTIRQIEERPLVYSDTNRNPKIELTGAKILSEEYPLEGRPILVFEEIEENLFRYMLLLPNDDGFMELTTFLESVPKRGRALKYEYINLEKMYDIWPRYPM